MRLILAFQLLALSLAAQEAPKPKTPMKAAPVSPEIGADGSVTFRLKAPKAQEVKVRGQIGKETALTKNEEGVWTATISVAPGVWEYSFQVDGLNTVDPLNPMIKPQRNPGTSILHVPSTPPAVWDLTDVPHGVTHQLDYQSKAAKCWRGLTVYTPPGALAAGKPLPVLYLSHGFSDNEKSWTTHGKAHWILDNLIAQGKAKPMIIVMPDGHAIPPGTGWKEDYAAENSRIYTEDLVGDVIPLVEKTFPVDSKPASRAFAGLSMGGRHAIYVAMNQAEKFHAVGAFSSAIPNAEQLTPGLADAKLTNSRLKLFWVACGREDFLFKANEGFHQQLQEKGLTHEYEVTGGGHTWPVWRDYLAKFATRLFQ
jgi:enterochelin esterase-like enzyme